MDQYSLYADAMSYFDDLAVRLSMNEEDREEKIDPV
jgi:hypothetical protein